MQRICTLFMLSQTQFPSPDLHILFSHWSHQIRFIQIRNLYTLARLPHPLAADHLKSLKEIIRIVPKKAYTGSSMQWLTQMQMSEMRSDETSLLLSHLWLQSHGLVYAQLPVKRYTDQPDTCRSSDGGQRSHSCCGGTACRLWHKYALWTHLLQKPKEIIPLMCKG